MTILLKKITSIRNWIGKLVLWLIGIIMIASQNYAYVLQGFMLTDKEIEFASATYITISSFGLLFFVGGIYLNKFLEKFTGVKKEENA